MSELINVNEIFNLIPHRYPFILIDKVLAYKDFDYLKAVKNVTINEPFFGGHFPQNPVMPGVLILEALAQASAVLSSLSRTPKEGYKFLYLFAGINNVKFKKKVIPGDQLHLEVKFEKEKCGFWFLHGEALVEGESVCSAELKSSAQEVKSDK